jgi:hypothetical protein
MRSRVVIGLVLVLLAVGVTVDANAGEPARGSSKALSALKSFEARHGTGWQTRWNKDTGTVRMLFGRSIEPTLVAESEKDYALMAFDVLASNSDLFGIAPEQLELVPGPELNLEKADPSDKVSVHFRQAIQGVPVYRSSVSALFSVEGHLTTVFLQHILPLNPEFDVTPRLNRSSAGLAAITARTAMGDEVELRLADMQLVVYPAVDSDGQTIPRLTWLVTVSPVNVGFTSDPAASLYVISADLDRPEVLDEWRLAWKNTETIAVEGTLQSYATSGIGPMESSPVETFPVDRALIEVDGYCEQPQQGGWTCDMATWVDGVSATANYLGHFSITGLEDISETSFVNRCPEGSGEDIGAGERCVTTGIQSDWVVVTDLLGGLTLDTHNWLDGLPETMTFLGLQQTPPTSAWTAPGNAYKWITAVRDWVRTYQNAVNFEDPFELSQLSANVNQASSGTGCNAGFSYDNNIPAVHFQRAHDLCNNTAFSTIIAHETGHFLTWGFLGGTLTRDHDQYNEGMADTFAMYIVDYPVVGEGNGMLALERDGRNTLQYTAMNTACASEDHWCKGQVLMGAMWKVMENLKETHGQYGYIEASNLLLEWHKFARYDGMIDPIIEETLLQVDDDDGDLSNGTPNFFDIDDAFLAQGFPGYDLPAQIHVFEPANNTLYGLGATETIRWDSRNVGGTVDIEISINGGVHWTVVKANTPNDKEESWVVGPAPTNQAIIRIKSHDVPSVVGQSTGTFAIADLDVTNPDGGENWEIGTTETILWANQYLPGYVDVELSRNGGNTWETLAIRTAASGSYDWVVTEPATIQARVRISSRTHSDIEDVSDGDFAIGFHYSVRSNGDGGDANTADGICADSAGNCTLRAAIEQANALPGLQTVEFGLAANDPPSTIRPASALPTISDPIVIDGTSQPLYGVVELDGSLAASGSGLRISAGNSVVRGLVINRFPAHGIVLVTGGNNTIQGNKIGTSLDGLNDLGNAAHGITIFNSSGNLIGGGDPGERNLISGNGFSGINIKNASSGNRIRGNWIGTDKTGSGSIGNSGIGIRFDGGASSNQIGDLTGALGNLVAFNGGQGVVVISGIDNSVAGGSIHSNGALAVDLGYNGVTANDPDDADEGANHLQNFPVIHEAVCKGGQLIVIGELQADPNYAATSYAIQLYNNTSCDSSGYGEAETYLGYTVVAVDTNGHATFEFDTTCKAQPGDGVTATATPRSDEGSRDLLYSTSELSACEVVQQ